MLGRMLQFSIKFTRQKRVRNMLSVPNGRLYYWISKVKFTEKHCVNDMLLELKCMTRKKELFPAKSLDLLLERFAVGKYTSIQSLDLLEACAISSYQSCHDIIMSKVWNTLHQNKHLLTPAHYRLMLRHYSLAGLPNEAENLFEELVSTGFTPNLVTYQYLIGAYARVGNINKIDELLAIMKKKDIVVNDTAYNYIIICHLKRRDLKNALSILELMDKNAFFVDQYAFCAFAEYYASQGDVDNIQLILKRSKNEMIEHYSWLLLKSIRKLAKSDYHLAIPSLMPLLPGAYDVDKAIRAAIELFVQDNLFDLLLEIIAAAFEDIPLYSSHLMQEMVYQKISSDRINAVWHKLNSLGITIENNFDVYKRAISSESPELITAIFTYMHQEKIPIPSSSFKNFLRLSAQQGNDQLFKTINLLCERFGFQPDSSFLRRIILPMLDWKTNPLETCNKLCATNLFSPKCVMAVVSACLHENDIHAAVAVANKNFFYFNSEEIIIRPLIHAYMATTDTVNFVRFIRIILNSISEFGAKISKDSDVEREKRACIEGILKTTFTCCGLDSSAMAGLLRSLIDHDIFLSKHTANSLIALQNVENTEIVSLLEKIGSMNDNASKNVQVSLVERHIDEMQLDKVLSILSKKTSNNQKYSLNVRTMHKFINLVIDGISNKTNKLHINSLYTKIVDNTTSKAKSLNDNPRIQFIFEPIFTEYRIDQCPMPLSLSKSFVKLSNRMIAAHLKNSNFLMAVLTFEHFIRIYGIGAMVETMFITLIEHEKYDLFQHIYQLNVKQHGEQATKIALAHAYIECDTRKRHQLAEDILKATEDLYGDRSEICEVILDFYCRRDIAKANTFVERCRKNEKFAPTKTFEEMLAKLK